MRTLDGSELNKSVPALSQLYDAQTSFLFSQYEVRTNFTTKDISVSSYIVRFLLQFFRSEVRTAQ